MPLVTSEKMLSDAQKGGYAVGAFNVENMAMAKAVIAAAEEMRSPVMLQTTPSTVKYGSLETFAAIV
ncbi:class II fructose-bisphosphate aldolase, partial [Thomasclavelia ramosa]|uniref:class II fructose-bisphosphate aldolase n=1 Tax=Thomasclavelia ramosa TaxID=1547 RepID=UPI001D028C5E